MAIYQQTGHIFAVRRECKNGAKSCRQVCANEELKNTSDTARYTYKVKVCEKMGKNLNIVLFSSQLHPSFGCIYPRLFSEALASTLFMFIIKLKPSPPMKSLDLRPGDTTIVRVPIVDQIFVAVYLILINKCCYANGSII